MFNHEIMTAIATAAAELPYQITGIQIIAHHRLTQPETGEAVHRVTVRVEFGGKIANLKVEKDTRGDIWWLVPGAGYSSPLYALQDELGL